MIRKLTESEVTFTITVAQDDEEVRGNLMDSGDPQVDLAAEVEVCDRIDRGDVWAWCEITVTASVCLQVDGAELLAQCQTTLCHCSYEDEADFIRCDDYYPQMKAEALEELNTCIAEKIGHGRMWAEFLERANVAAEATEVPISKEKQTYTVYADVVINPSAEYDAHSPEEALEMAQDDDAHRVVLCYQCGRFEPSEPDNWRVEDAQGNTVLEENVE